MIVICIFNHFIYKDSGKIKFYGTLMSISIKIGKYIVEVIFNEKFKS